MDGVGELGGRVDGDAVEGGHHVVASQPGGRRGCAWSDLVELGAATEAVTGQYDVLATEAVVQAAIATAEARNNGAPKQVRKTLYVSAFGRDFWAACDPSRPGKFRSRSFP